MIGSIPIDHSLPSGLAAANPSAPLDPNRKPPGTTWEPPLNSVQPGLADATVPIKVARFPWEGPREVQPAPKETVDEQRTRFEPSTTYGQQGLVTAEASNKPLSTFGFRDSHGKLRLPNLNDDVENGRKVTNPDTGRAYESYNELQKNKDNIWKTTHIYAFGAPLASQMMRHYLGASGQDLETFIELKHFTSPQKVDNYRAQLERSAIKFAQDNRSISEFTIQGPGYYEDMKLGTDVYFALGRYRLAGRAHYKVNRDDNGNVTLDGQTQMFVYDRYNFKSKGYGFPFPNGGSAPQSHLLQMTITNDPKTGKPMARSFDFFGFEPPQDSYIKSAARR